MNSTLVGPTASDADAIRAGRRRRAGVRLALASRPTSPLAIQFQQTVNQAW